MNKQKQGKIGLIILIVIIAIVVIAGIWFVGANNSLISAEETIKQNQAEIDNQLKNRSELVPNLVNTVKGITGQEQTIVDSITSARTKMTTGNTQDKLNANSDLTRNINLIIENYPEIKSNEAFTSLMDELAELQNKITYANKKYNDSVGEFNKSIKTFPNNLVASIFNHKEATYLQVSDADKEVPNVQF